MEPDIFFFSGGGNDIAGNEFKSYLHHSESGLGVLKQPYADNTIRGTFKKYYQDLIDKVLDASSTTHIFSHGYGYARATGKGTEILIFEFFGPWLLPALAEKRINPETEGKQAIEHLIDGFNQMLQELDTENEKFHYVDFRQIISDDDWRDELHLKSSAYRLASDLINQKIESVFI